MNTNTEDRGTWIARTRIATAAVVTTVALAAAVAGYAQTASATTAVPSVAAHEAAFAHDVAVMLNRERQANQLPPLRVNAKLINSAHAHNLQMASHNTMSHQLPGEPPIGNRVTATGLPWTSAGENIGWNGDMSVVGARYLEQIMYDEKPPGDVGHRVNILSRQYNSMGVDVFFDTVHHKLWLTEDFSKS